MPAGALHEHVHLHEHALPPSGDATVLLDIGGDIGALVVHTTGALEGRELDLFPSASGTPFVHSAVRRREVVGGHVYAAVYPGLPAGEYRVEGVPGVVSIRGGEVSEVRHPG